MVYNLFYNYRGIDCIEMCCKNDSPIGGNFWYLIKANEADI